MLCELFSVSVQVFVGDISDKQLKKQEQLTI